MAVLVSDGNELAHWPIDVASDPDLAVIDVLARLQLLARRLGCTIRLRGASKELLDLLELAGLTDVLGT